MKTKLAIAAIAAAFSMVAVAGDAEYTALDADQDGVISVQESEANSALGEKFTEVDVNQDGQIDKAEFAQFEETQ